MKEYLQEFYDYQKTIFTITSLTELLARDQEVNLPAKAAASRGNQMAFVSSLYQEYVTRPSYSDLVCRLHDHADTLSSTDRRCVELAKRDIELYTRIPKRFIEEYEKAKVFSQQAREYAKKNNTFSAFIAPLQKTFDLTKEYGTYLTKTGDPYDGMLEYFEEGATTGFYDTLFEGFEEVLRPMVQKYASLPKSDSTFMRIESSESEMEAFLKQRMKTIGFDFDRGLLSSIVHPACFTIGFDDHRVTTRYETIIETCFHTFHELGHALYEMYGNKAYEDTYLAGGVSFGIHESQSRLLENILFKSMPGATFLVSRLQEHFRASFSDWNAEGLYDAVNYIHPTVTRMEADEVTYNLHILLRYELEKQLFAGSLRIEDIPEARNSLMKKYLGIAPEDDMKGCLQDVHRSAGYFGYFPAYALGNIYSGQLWHSFTKAVPGWDRQIAGGDFTGYRSRFGEHVWQYGRLLSPQQLIEKATGEALSSKPYITYLTDKYT